MSKPRILFSIPTRHHVEIALDELDGMQQLGYTCGGFNYAAKEGVTSTPHRLLVIFQNAIKLIRIARKFKPDVIYFNSRLEELAGIRDFITIGLVKTFYRKPVKFVIKSHGSDITVFDKDGKLVKRVMAYLSKNVSGWLFLSSEEKNIVIWRQLLPADRIFITKNIVRTQQFYRDAEFKQRLNIPDDDAVLLFVGRLIKEKGVYQVLEAFAKLSINTRATLIIVGWGPEDEILKKLSSSLGIASRVIFTGFIPESEVVPYYANCDVLVFPTYFPEGFPMALFNSVSAGLPVVTTPIRAATDYLSAPENCLWIEPQNSQSVYHAIVELLQSPSLMSSMRQNNLVKASIFNRDSVCMELAETIKMIMK